ncbi:MAG: DUF4292 domain-containing protein [Acidobacteria bacterium]|nr:DUF4292 domain-containing protein [Acidobacteriota bacterium]
MLPITGLFRIPVRVVWIWVAAALALSSGCLVRHRKLERATHRNAPLLSAGVEQLTEMLRQRYQSIETLNAIVDLEPSVLSASKGEIADYKDVRGYILVRKPAWIRVVGLYPVVRTTAFDMVSDGRTFRVYLPGKNLFLVGQNRIDQPSPRKLENLRPEHLLDALLIRPPNETERAVVENWSEGGTPAYILHVIERDAPGRWQLARNVWFDRASLEIQRQQLFDQKGEVVTDARYAGWERHGGVVFPNRMVITRPKDEYELSIEFSKSTFNEPIGPEKFELAQPPGVKVQRVGETPATAAGGKAGGQ